MIKLNSRRRRRRRVTAKGTFWTGEFRVWLRLFRRDLNLRKSQRIRDQQQMASGGQCAVKLE